MKIIEEVKRRIEYKKTAKIVDYAIEKMTEHSKDEDSTIWEFWANQADLANKRLTELLPN